MGTDRSKRLHWGWIISSAALGVALLGVAHIAELKWKWPNVSVGVISNVGTAFLLAFILFTFERRFTRNVAAKVRDVAEAVVLSQTREFDSRLDDLEERLNARRAKTESTQDEVLDAIVDNVSFETISSALTAAGEVGAIRNESLTVPGSSEKPWLAVQFFYAPGRITRGDGFVLDDGTVARLTIVVEFFRRPTDHARPAILAEWTPDLSGEEIGSALETDLRRFDRLAEAKAFDFPLAIRNLERGLRVALENQRLPHGEEKLHGALYEVVTAEWAITSAGLENTASGQVFSRGELGFSFQTEPSEEQRDASMPAGTNSDVWKYVMHRVGRQPMPNLFG
jgi:hypothetical protein